MICNLKVNSKKNIYYDWYKKKVNNFDEIDQIVTRTHFISNKSDKWDFYSNGFVDYIADHQKLMDLEQAHNFKGEFQTSNLQSNFGYVDYMIRDSAKQKMDHLDSKNYVWEYSNVYMYNKQEISTKEKTSRNCRWELKHKNNISRINPNSHIWSIVISEKDPLLRELMFKNQHIIVDRYLRAIFKHPVNAIASFHDNTNHPHIHVVAYQSDVILNSHLERTSMIRKNILNNGRKAIAYLRFRNEKYWNKILNEKRKIKQSFDSEKISKYFLDEFKSMTRILNGKYEYNRLAINQKIEIDKFFNKLNTILTNDSEINNYQKNYKNFNKMCESYIQKFSSLKNEDNRDSLIEQISKLQKENNIEIKNKILKLIKKFDFELRGKYTKKNDDLKSENPNGIENFYIKNNTPRFNKRAIKVFAQIFAIQDSLSKVNSDSLNEFKKILNSIKIKEKESNYEK